MLSQGYGICGHKNSYSSYVRDGNWNEDRFGTELLSNRVPLSPSKYLQTEHRRNYGNPREIPPDPKLSLVKMESMETIRSKNKDGLSYSLLFQHGQNLQDPKDRFRTTQQISNSTFQKYAIQDGTRSFNRDKDMNRDADEVYNMTTTSRTANMRVTSSPPRSASRRRVEVDPSPLPRWNRRSRK